MEIFEVDRLEMRLDSRPCAFSLAHRAAIDANFAVRLRRQPDIWNGRILILVEHLLDGATLTGRYAETDYASLLWLLAAEPPLAGPRNAFAMGALRGADGGFVLARMASWTANAGRIYFAAGTPDPGDVTPDGRVDLEGSLLRELTEETGLGPADVGLAPCWTVLRDTRRLALMRPLLARSSADELADRIRAHIATEDRPEIDAVIVARGPRDIVEGMPPFIRAYLAWVWGQPEKAA